jgi:hypothetical protein
MKKVIAGFMIFATFLQGKSQDKLNPSVQIPIMVFSGVPQEETSPYRYEEMKNVGITHAYTFFSSADAMLNALDLAEKAGVKMLVSCPELKENPEETVRRFMHHPAVGGYYIIDEPNRKIFPDLGKWVRRIRSVDDHHFCYINLFPNYADTIQLGTKSYGEHLRKFIEEVPVQIISFDYYPISNVPQIVDGWYENLELISRESALAGKPFWAFALSTLYDNSQPVPTLATLRLQVYSNLAYGAQGIQYYTYWSTPGHRNGPIEVDGRRSTGYDRLKMMNEEIKNLSGVFSGAKVISVGHLGSKREPRGTKRFNQLPPSIHVLETGGAPALVSRLKNGDQTFMVIVNCDYRNQMNLTLYGDSTLRKVLKDGSLVPANVYTNTIAVEPGDAAIYLLPEAGQKL